MCTSYSIVQGRRCIGPKRRIVIGAVRTFVLARGPAAASFILYVVSLPPAVRTWDVGESQTVPYIAGIMHPTGFPLYTLVGWLFSHLLPFGNVAWRMSLLSAVAAALAVDRLFVTARLLGASWFLALSGALLFATCDIVWYHVTEASVAALATLFAVATLECAIRFALLRSRRWYYTACAFLGAALCTHPITLWSIPGLAVAIVGTPARMLLTVRTLAVGMALVALSFTAYVYFPLRSGYVSTHDLDPVRVELGLSGQPFWDYDHPSTAAGFMALVTGSELHASSQVAAAFDVRRFPAYLDRFLAVARSQYGIVALLFVFFLALERDRQRIAILAAIFLTVVAVFPFSVYATPIDVDKYYVAPLWSLALLLTLGAERTATIAILRPRRVVGAVCFAVFVVTAAFNLKQTAPDIAQRQQNRVPQFAIDSVIRLTPANAIIAAGWSYATPLAYAAYVEQRFENRLILSYDNVDPATVVGLARRRDVFYMPFPREFTLVPGACVERIPTSEPPLYRVRALSVDPLFKSDDAGICVTRR